MCLSINEKVQLPKSKRNYFIGYKVVRVRPETAVFNKEITSLHQTSFAWKSKWNIGCRHYRPGMFTRNIYDGIHVFISKLQASRVADGYYNGVVMPVRCYYANFIASGYNPGFLPGAVFSKVYLEKRTYNRILNDA